MARRLLDLDQIDFQNGDDKQGALDAFTNISSVPNEYILTKDTTTGHAMFKVAPSTSPAGATSQIQFNNAGAFGASSDFTWDNTNKTVNELRNTSSTTPMIDIQNSGTGDAAMRFGITGDSWIVGVDNSDADKFKISYGSSINNAVLGTADIIGIDPSLIYIYSSNVELGNDKRLTIRNSDYTKSLECRAGKMSALWSARVNASGGIENIGGFYGTIEQANTAQAGYNALTGFLRYSLERGETNTNTLGISGLSFLCERGDTDNYYEDGFGGGTLESLQGIDLTYGQGGETSTSITTNMTGLRLNPIMNGGTVTNFKDIYIKAPYYPTTTLTNPYYSIYQEYAFSKNYFAGSVGVGELLPDYKLDVNGTFGFTPGSSVTPVDNGDVVFELTNNTTLKIKAKGSDGTIRSVSLMLM